MNTSPAGQWPPHLPGPEGRPPWSPQPGSAKSTGVAGKWVLVGLALLVVVVVTVVATVLFTRDGSAPNATSTATSPPASTVDAGIASANDDGPVEIVTEEPTCDAWTPIGDTFAAKASKGWNDRDPSIPASNWTGDQRAQYEEIAEAMRSAADQAVALAKLTPHRVIRQLYEQAIAYWRAYADKVPTYLPDDDHLARVATSATNALIWICSAIDFGSAQARAPLTVPAPAPLEVARIGNPNDPQRFLTELLPVCADWTAAVDAFDAETGHWLQTDPNVPAAEWSPERNALYVEMSQIMAANANQIQDLGLRSQNPTFDDFAALASQYRRAYVQSFPRYVPADGYLANSAAQLVALNNEACLAAGRS